MNRVVRNAGWIIGARVLQMLLGLIVSAWTARFLGPSNTGIISYVSAYVSFFTSIATLGLNNVIVKELVDYKERQNEVLGTAIVMRIISSVLCSICVIALVTLLNPGDRLMTMVAVILSLSLVFQSFEMISYWYQSRLESKVSAMIQTAAYLCVAGFRLVGLVTGKDVLWFAFANSLDAIVIAVLSYVIWKKSNPKGMAVSWSLGKEMFSKSHHFIYSSLMIAIYSQMDTIMIKGYMSKADVGYYSIATGINSMWSFVLQAIIDSVYPTIVEAKKDGNEDLYHKRIIELYSIVFWLSVLACVMIDLLARPIILILYGQEYIPSIGCLRVATWINLFAFLGVARGAWMVCEDNQVYQKWILGIGAGANLIMNSLMIPVLGISGAALATVLTQVITSMIAPLFFRRTRENTGFIIQGMNPAVFIDVLRHLQRKA